MVGDLGGSGPPADYHDYVFRDGRLVGAFDEMYRNAAEIPWHQDDARERVDCTVAVQLLRHFGPYQAVLEVGCGLGYFASMLHDALQPGSLLGVDISAEAVRKAQARFPRLAFEVADLRAPGVLPKRLFDLVVVRGFFWYVFPQLATVVRNLAAVTAPAGHLFVSQNFPPLDQPFVGKDVIPNPESLVGRFDELFDVRATLTLDVPTGENANDNWIMFLARRR